MAVLREDTVKVTFDVDDKPLEQVDSGIDKLVHNTQKMAGPGGVGKLTEGFNETAEAAKKMSGTKFTSVKDSIKETAAKLTEGEKGAKGFGNAVKNVAKASMSKLTSGLKKVGTGLSSALKTAGKLSLKLAGLTMKGLLAGVGAGITALGALGAKAIQGYAEYEQLVGGVQTLFKDNSKDVVKYANDAYKTAGLSANEYMSTVTSFSASLLQSMGGDTAAAAKQADMAITDMADNANKMGSDLGTLQTAYAGFAKQNYTMLDNLKLGYGGTKEEMQRLLTDAEKLSGQKFDISSYADIVSAIHVVQTEMGITGTTAKEASSTIQGSFSSMKSAFSNFLTGMADPNQDFDQLVGNLIDSVVTFGNNLIPRIQALAPRLVEGVAQLAHSLVPVIPGLIDDLLPPLVEGALSLVTSLVTTLQQNAGQLSDTAIELAMQLVFGFLQMLPQVLSIGMDILISLIQGLTQQAPALIQTAASTVLTLINGLTQSLPMLLQMGLQLLVSLCQGLIQALPQLLIAAVQLIVSLVQFFMQNLPTIIQTGLQLVIALINGIVSAIPQIAAMIPQLIVTIVQGLFSINWLQVGWDLIKAIFKGVWDGAVGLFSGLWDGIKGLFSGESKEVGAATSESLASGIQSSSYVATNELSSFATSTTDFGAQAATNLAGGLTANAGQITTAASTSMTNTNTVMQTGMDTIAQTVNNTDLSSSGVSVMQGLNNGMESMIPTLRATAAKAASEIKKATDVELKIHSPSRVMEESGEYTGMGQVKGLRNTIPEMKIAAKEVSNASIPYESYSPDSGSAYYGGGDSSYTTVSPVFNLSISGSQDDRALARKVKRYVASAITETFESLERKSYSLREV